MSCVQFDVGETYFLVETDSTNNEAKRLALKGVETDVLIIADKQTQGKGRLGRSFYSPKSTGLYMTYMYSAKADLQGSTFVTSAAAVATVKAINELTGLCPQIKWVNDLILNGKKVCGILCESVTNSQNGKTYIIVGIGVNVSTSDFPQDLQAIAASLNAKRLDVKTLANSIVSYLKEYIKPQNKAQVMDEYRRLSLVLGKEVSFVKDGKEYGATAQSIDDDGRLIVTLKNGDTQVLFFGEISIKLN